MLVAMRVLQGAGGALMVPVGRLVVLRVTAKRDMLDAIAYLTWPALLAPVSPRRWAAGSSPSRAGTGSS